MKKYAVPNKTVCVACGMCLKDCPREAITIHLGCHALVDTEKCVGCGRCAKVCPAGCITVTERSAAK